MATKPLTVTKDQAVQLFKEIGMAAADKWDVSRLQAKLGKIDEMVDEDTVPEDAAVQAVLDDVLEAIETGRPVTVKAPTARKAAGKATGRAAKTTKTAKTKTAKATKPAAAKTKTAKTPTRARKRVTKGADKPAATKTTKTTKGTKAAKATKADKAAGATRADGPGLSCVRETPSRPYYAGVVLAKHGMDGGVTPAMAVEVDKLYGRANPRESMFCLRNAWHAFRGYSDNA